MATHELDNHYLQYAKEEEVLSKGEDSFTTHSEGLLNISNRHMNEQAYLNRMFNTIVCHIWNEDLLNIIRNRGYSTSPLSP